MQTILNFLDYNYDKYVLLACLIGTLGFLCYAGLKKFYSTTTHSFWFWLGSFVVIGAFLYIAIGAFTFLYSGAGKTELTYKEQNDSLVTVNKSLSVENDSLRKLYQIGQVKIDNSNDKIKNLQKQINDTKLNYDEKIINIDRADSDDIDLFFSGYKTRYNDITNIN